MIKLMSCLIFAVTIISSCSKKSDPKLTTIDVSKQWSIDFQHNVISSFGDGQWQNKTFTAQELNLFSSLDTTNLSGTTTPSSVIESSPGYNSCYPNPFTTVYALSLWFADGYSGQIALKFVVVDSTMMPYTNGTARLNVINSSINVTFNPTIPVGRFRFYYTLSSQANQHFYKSWGNIQKTP